MFVAKEKDEKEQIKDIETDTNIIYRIGKPMKQENRDTVREKYIRDDNGVLAFNEDKSKHGSSIMKGYWILNFPGNTDTKTNEPRKQGYCW